jgi:PAS domain S-box-containing protein
MELNDQPSGNNHPAPPTTRNWSELFPPDVTQAEEAIVLTDWKGRIEWANTGFLRLTEYTLAEAIGRKPGALLQGTDTDHRVVEAMHAAITLGHQISVTVRNYTKQSRPYDVALAITPLLDRQGVVQHFGSVAMEITGGSALSTQTAMAHVLARLADVILIYQSALEA